MSDDVKMSDRAYVANGALLTDDDGREYTQEGTELYNVNFEQPDEQGNVVGFQGEDGREYLVGSESVVYRLED